MTDTSSLSHLIERLEKATGPDRELDAEIYRAAFNAEVWSYNDNCHIDAQVRNGLWLGSREDHPDFEAGLDGVITWRFKHGDKHGELPRLTDSIDAAMTLVPEGMTCGFSGPIRRSSGVGHEGMFFGMCGSVPDDGFHIAVIAKTPAIALCIAALKAQLSTRTNEQDDARNLSGVSSE